MIFRKVLRPLAMQIVVCSAALMMVGCGVIRPKSPENFDKPPQDGQSVPSAAAAGKANNAEAAAEANRSTRPAFDLEVVTDDKKVRTLLEDNLELQRYRTLDDLGVAEVSRLMVAAEPNARELLNTLGYFTPHLTLELKETPQSDAPRKVVITVDPGPLTSVSAVNVDFAGDIAKNAGASGQRAAIVTGWSLPEGRTFTQSDWGAAKNGGLRLLTSTRYPTGKLGTSQASVDADTHDAKLDVTYDSGPLYRFGPVELRGSERYDAVGALRIARVPVGEEYDQQKLLDAQQRLASSGYYDSVFLTLDTAGTDPLKAPVIAQVREAPLQKVVFGAGFTTDSGPRLSLDYTHNKVPLLGWRDLTKISIDTKNPLISSELTSLPDFDGWRWFGSALAQRAQQGDYDEDGARLRAGRNKSDGDIDRSVFLQYDYAVPRLRTVPEPGLGDFANFGAFAGTPMAANTPDAAPPTASTLSLNWGWTGRYFDNAMNPQRGYGVSAELGAGYTLLGAKLPYVRARLRWLGLVSLGPVESSDGASRRDSRLQFRAETGAILAKDSARIPSTQRFLTGGDLTVRGYSYQEIGTTDARGLTVAGRYMVSTGVEWQRPIVWNGRLSEFESVVFVDAGAVADRASQLKLKVGTGVGVRWNSPVGLVQADVAYGVAVRKFRLHLRLGFTF